MQSEAILQTPVLLVGIPVLVQNLLSLVRRLETWLATPSLETAWAMSGLGLSRALRDS